MIYDPFPDKDEEWHELFEECHKDEWREEEIDRRNGYREDEEDE